MGTCRRGWTLSVPCFGAGRCPRFRDARPRRLRYEVFTLPAALTTHARQLTAQLGVPPLTAAELITARGTLRALRTAVQTAERGISG